MTTTRRYAAQAALALLGINDTDAAIRSLALAPDTARAIAWLRAGREAEAREIMEGWADEVGD